MIYRHETVKTKVKYKGDEIKNMGSRLDELIGEIESRGIFKRNKKDIRVKILSALLYFLGLSFRKTSKFMSIFQDISHESVRNYYHKLKDVIKPPKKRREDSLPLTRLSCI